MRVRGLNWWTAAIQPHAATVAVSQRLVHDWTIAVASSAMTSWARYQWTYGLKATSYSTHPVVRVKCTNAQNLSADTDQAAFPYLYGAKTSGYREAAVNSSETRFTYWAEDSRHASISGLDRNTTSSVRTQWLPLPPETFGVIDFHVKSSGLLVEYPWASDSRAVICCTVSAAWHDYTVTSERSVDYDAWVINVVDNDAKDDYNSVRYSRPVSLDDSWLGILTPSAPETRSEGGKDTSNTLESLLVDTSYANAIVDLRTRPQMLWDGSTSSCVEGMSNVSLTDTEVWNDDACGKGAKREYLEFLISSLVADGLSRYGSHRVYDMQPDLRDWTIHQPSVDKSTRLLKSLPNSPPPLPDRVPQSLRIDAEGYAYFASTTTDYLALAVASAYIIIAGAHLLWMLWPGNLSSSAWDTITQLLVLCQASPPPVSSQLDNTAAGIDHMRTYATVVRIRTVPEAGKARKRRLRLIVDDDTGSSQATLLRVEADVEYG